MWIPSRVCVVTSQPRPTTATMNRAGVGVLLAAPGSVLVEPHREGDRRLHHPVEDEQSGFQRRSSEVDRQDSTHEYSLLVATRCENPIRVEGWPEAVGQVKAGRPVPAILILASGRASCRGSRRQSCACNARKPFARYRAATPASQNENRWAVRSSATPMRRSRRRPPALRWGNRPSRTAGYGSGVASVVRCPIRMKQECAHARR